MADGNKMQYVRLGSTGIPPLPRMYGIGNTEWMGWQIPEKEFIDLIGEVYKRGINFFDTADVYSNGGSEIILGKAIKQFDMPRSRIVVATKAGLCVHEDIRFTPAPSGDPHYVNRLGTSRKYLFEAIDASLKRLDLEYIDLNLYNLLYREEEHKMVPYCLDSGIGTTPWSPLAMDALTRTRDTSTKRSENYMWIHKNFMMAREEKDNDVIVDQVLAIAEKRGVSAAQVSLAWVLSKPHVSSPIMGVTKLNHLDDLIAALDLKLTEEEIESLETLYAPRFQMPFSF